MKALDIVTVSFKNLFRQKARTFLTVVSMMVGAFLISIMLSVGNGLKEFMVSQVTMFSNTRTIGVQQSYDAGSMGFGFGGGVQEFEEEETDDFGQNDGEQASTQKQQEVPDGVTVETQTGATGVQARIEEAMLDNSDLEKIQEIDNIEEATFEPIVNPDYVRLDEEDSEERNKKLQINLYGMPIGIRKELTFSLLDEELLDLEDSIVLSDGYAEEWEIDREELLGEKVFVRVAKTGVVESGSLAMGSAGMPTAADQRPETKEYELTIAGFIEKSLLSQIGFITTDMANTMNAYIADKELDEYLEEEKAFEIVVIVDSDENVEAVDKAIEDLGYQSMTYEETLGQIGVIFDVIGAVLSSFGVIAMFVASIGIANTLLMAIYERTREIGVMKAVGAPRYVIGSLFTSEAAWLGLLGGLFGLIVSWMLGRLANWILHEGITIGRFRILEGYLADYPTFDISVFSFNIIAVVLIVTTSVAFVAGLYPAWRASRLDPIDALRHD